MNLIPVRVCHRDAIGHIVAFSANSAKCFSLILLLCLSGCATLTPEFDEPDVEVTSIHRLPAEGMEQRFSVGLRVTNPNSETLAIKGLSYSLSIEDYKVASGVTAEIPVIEPYSEARFSLPVSTSFINSMRLVKHLIELNKPSLTYRLEAKLDLGLTFMPKMSVVEEGEVQLGQIK
ncbi:hypothetical protein G8770_21000 [Aestuariicella hydrocarbonica]|uniref:Water stress and hypersensitive response domain-containing protein n=1 Tax=Pseudomaricurvus hydrocarbonicus TaxID=1470433 RepID=A0A9E5MPN4_9GAMM|nr:LEA type 2 family protein [Aestuariicella hydrocarbonica]NHO68033.1 hypothetical protein [Aestuariicella hydrocarbonica]